MNTSLVYLIIVSKLNNFLTDKERHWAAFAILTNNVFRCASISLFEVVSQRVSEQLTFLQIFSKSISTCDTSNTCNARNIRNTRDTPNTYKKYE